MTLFSSRLLRAVAAIGVVSGSIGAVDARPTHNGGAARSTGATARTSHHKSATRSGGAATAHRAGANAGRSNHANRNVNTHRSANVNVNHNVNVSHGVGGYGYNRHPVARAATVGAMAVTTGAVIGSMYHTLPSNCATVVHAGGTYHHCGSAWYQSRNGEYIAVVAP